MNTIIIEKEMLPAIKGLAMLTEDKLLNTKSVYDVFKNIRWDGEYLFATNGKSILAVTVSDEHLKSELGEGEKFYKFRKPDMLIEETDCDKIYPPKAIEMLTKTQACPLYSIEPPRIDLFQKHPEYYLGVCTLYRFGMLIPPSAFDCLKGLTSEMVNIHFGDYVTDEGHHYIMLSNSDESIRMVTLDTAIEGDRHLPSPEEIIAGVTESNAEEVIKGFAKTAGMMLSKLNYKYDVLDDIDLEEFDRGFDEGEAKIDQYKTAWSIPNLGGRRYITAEDKEKGKQIIVDPETGEVIKEVKDEDKADA